MSQNALGYMTKNFSYVPLNLGAGNGTQIKNIEGNVTNLMKGFYVDLPSTAVGGGGIVAAPPIPPGTKNDGKEIHEKAFQDQTIDEIDQEREKRGDNFVINARNFSTGPWMTMDALRGSTMFNCGLVAIGGAGEDRLVNGFVRGSEEQFAYILYSTEGAGEPWDPAEEPYIQIRNSKVNDGIYELLCDDTANGRLYIRYSTGLEPMDNLPDPIPSVFASQGITVNSVSDISPQKAFTSNNVHSGGDDSDMRAIPLTSGDVSVLHSMGQSPGFAVGHADDTSPILTEDFPQTVTYKTITDVTNDVAANKLHSQTKIVNVDANDAQNGYVLTATSDTTAEWKAIPAGQTLTGGTNVTITSNQINVGGAQKFNVNEIDSHSSGAIFFHDPIQTAGLRMHHNFGQLNLNYNPSEPTANYTGSGFLSIVSYTEVQDTFAGIFTESTIKTSTGSVFSENDIIHVRLNDYTSPNSGIYVVDSHDSDGVLTIKYGGDHVAKTECGFQTIFPASTAGIGTITKCNVRCVRMNENTEELEYGHGNIYPLYWNHNKRIFEDHFLNMHLDKTPYEPSALDFLTNLLSVLNFASFLNSPYQYNSLLVIANQSPYDVWHGINTGKNYWVVATEKDQFFNCAPIKVTERNVPALLIGNTDMNNTIVYSPFGVYSSYPVGGVGKYTDWIYECDFSWNYTSTWISGCFFVGLVEDGTNPIKISKYTSLGADIDDDLWKMHAIGVFHTFNAEPQCPYLCYTISDQNRLGFVGTSLYYDEETLAQYGGPSGNSSHADQRLGSMIRLTMNSVRGKDKIRMELKLIHPHYPETVLKTVEVDDPAYFSPTTSLSPAFYLNGDIKETTAIIVNRIKITHMSSE